MAEYLPRNAAMVPDKLKASTLRACLRCKLLKSIEQFRQDGCDNCGDLAGWDAQSYTTPSFKGSGQTSESAHTRTSAPPDAHSMRLPSSLS